MQREHSSHLPPNKDRGPCHEKSVPAPQILFTLHVQPFPELYQMMSTAQQITLQDLEYADIKYLPDVTDSN